MGARNLLILFFSALAISLVLLILVLAIFFEPLDLTFKTHLPEAAPTSAQIESKLPGEEDSAQDEIPLTPEPKPSLSIKVPGESQTKSSAPTNKTAAEAPEKPSETKPTVGPPLPDAPTKQEPPSEKPVPEQAKQPKKPGTPVQASPIKAPASATLFRVYVTGFSSLSDAQMAASRYASLGVNPTARSLNGRPVLQLGVFSNKAHATTLANQTGAAVQAIN